MLLCQHCGIFPKMHIASIQIGDVFIGVHRKLHERRVFGRASWPRPPWLHGWSSWLVKLLFFRCALAGKHISSQATTQYSPSQYGCHAEEPIEGKGPAPYILTGANIPRPLCRRVPHSVTLAVAKQQACSGKQATSHFPTSASLDVEIIVAPRSITAAGCY